MEQDAQKELVRARYGGIAEAASAASCCAPASSCCSPSADPASKSREMGYSEAELAAVPEGANLGLGCGNPQAIAALKPGETVIDLGSGAGFDCFLAAGQVWRDGLCHWRRHDAGRAGDRLLLFGKGRPREVVHRKHLLGSGLLSL